MTGDLPAVALLAANDKTLVGALMAVDRLAVATGLLVLLAEPASLPLPGCQHQPGR